MSHTAKFLLILTLVSLRASSTNAGENAEEAKVIAKVELLGANVTRDDNLPDHPVIGIEFRGNQKISDGYIPLLKTFSRLTSST